ncbi:MAG: glycerol kinase GlpK [Cyclobacteriaceae bacterium]|nr:glycerol kinase GlpK [Cyclobacteriaceae bacterium]
MKKYIIALDAGTTSNRAVIFDKDLNIVGISQNEFTQIYPEPGWVEHDANEIWTSQLSVLLDVLKKNSIPPNAVAALGITNQRETTIIWDRATGVPVCNAIVWQDRRTASYCESLKKNHAESIRKKTGLVIDAYFSATKIRWILDNIKGARDRAVNGELAFGTVETWLVWNLTKGRLHITDASNASRTMLFNINTLTWDKELLDLFNIPKALLPEVVDSSAKYGATDKSILGESIAISGMAGDQQCSLFGQLCLEKGMVKNTYGTGSFVMMNTGDKPALNTENLLATIAWKIGSSAQYAVEGSIFVGGALVQWLRDSLKIIKSSAEIEILASQVEDSGGIVIVPAFAGLGAPHWDQFARGTIFGITRATLPSHIARAALEAIALQVKDAIDEMSRATGIPVKQMNVDGGASVNNLLMQLQSDLLNSIVVRPAVTETTALGAALLAGLAEGFWTDMDDIKKRWKVDKTFKPNHSQKHDELLRYWVKAVDRTKHWIEN